MYTQRPGLAPTGPQAHAVASDGAPPPARARKTTQQRAGNVTALPIPKGTGAREIARPAERALDSLRAVYEFVIKPGAESLLLEIEEGKAARTAVFPFEAIMRNAAVRFSGFKKHLRHVKALEDAVGHHIDAIERLAEMRTFGQADLINHWAHRQTEQRELLTTVLTSRWLAHSAGDKCEVPLLVRDLRAAPWGDLAADREANAAGLRREAKRVVKAFDKNELDMNDMEDVHKVRRLCRWYALDANRLSGAIVLVDGGAPKKFDGYIEKAANSQFKSLPPAKREANALTLSQSLWSGAAYIIDELGEVKKKGETLIALTEALVDERGLTHEQGEKEALAMMKVSPQERKSWTRRAETLFAEARDIFEAIAEQMEAQMERPKKK